MGRPLTVSVIGAGRIGAPVVDFVERTPGFALAGVLTRGSGGPWQETLIAAGPDIVIDAAGPGALAAYGADVLVRAEFWTVGAAALGDAALRDRLTETARAAGTRLRLFSPWVAGLGQAGPEDRLEVTMERPGLAPWRGPLAEALARAPDDLNSATAAALFGPGIDATTVTLKDTGPGGAHRMRARLTTGGALFRTEAEFDAAPDAIHPTAAALIGALDALVRPVGYG